MKTVQVYDPPMCCSTGLCGTDIDPALVQLCRAADASLSQKGVKVERYNLGQQPMAFVQNPTVKALLETEGVAALPLILVDGEIHLKGRYLTTTSARRFTRAALGRVQRGSREIAPLTRPTRRPRHATCFSPARAAWAKLRWPAPRPCSWPKPASGCCWSAPTRPRTSTKCSETTLGEQAHADSRRTGLHALNIDPEAAAAAYRERVVGPMRGLLPEAALRSMEEQLSGSCTVEIAAFDEFSGLIGNAGITRVTSTTSSSTPRRPGTRCG